MLGGTPPAKNSFQGTFFSGPWRFICVKPHSLDRFVSQQDSKPLACEPLPNNGIPKRDLADIELKTYF